VSAVAICIIASYFYIVFRGLYIIYYIYYRINNNKRYYLYLDAYIDIAKYKRFLDEFQKNIIIKDEQIVTPTEKKNETQLIFIYLKTMF